MILVVGATSLVGGMIARNLLDRREEVRILVRPGSSYQQLVADGAEPVEDDLKDPASPIMLPLIVGGPASAERPVTVIGAGRRQHSFVAARDLAAFAAAAVRHAAALNRRIVIGGPTASRGGTQLLLMSVC
jgi:uncharacterized protein YbjT (DUF2867 family)